MATISIPKEKIEKQKGVVIMSLKEYRRLIGKTVPVYRLENRKARALDALVANGLQEYHQGKTRTIKSLQDLD